MQFSPRDGHTEEAASSIFAVCPGRSAAASSGSSSSTAVELRPGALGISAEPRSTDLRASAAEEAPAGSFGLEWPGPSAVHVQTCSEAWKGLHCATSQLPVMPRRTRANPKGLKARISALCLELWSTFCKDALALIQRPRPACKCTMLCRDTSWRRKDISKHIAHSAVCRCRHSCG